MLARFDGNPNGKKLNAKAKPLVPIGVSLWIGEHPWRRGLCADRKSRRGGGLLHTALVSDGLNEIGWGHPRYEEIINKGKEFDADLIVQHCRAYAKIEHYHLTHDSWELVRRCPIPVLLVKNGEWGSDMTVMAAVDPMHSHNKPESLDNRVIDAASIVTSRLEGEMHVVHAYAETARPFAVAGTIKSEHSKAFDDLLKDYSIDKDHQHLIDETPLYALKDYSEESNSDIVVMGAISRSRLSEALIGSTTDAALDYIKKDLLIIKPASM